jgi:hypothetical protein
MARNFLYCEETDTKIYPNDVVSISTYPENKWIAKTGWYKLGTARKNGWYFVAISADKTILPIDLVDIINITKEVNQQSTAIRPEIPKTQPQPEINYLYCKETDTKIYANDIVTTSTGLNLVAKHGWYVFNNENTNGWYFISVEDRSVIPANDIDLTTVVKEQVVGTSELRPTLQDMETPTENNFLVIPGTDIRIYDSDIVKISNKPNTKWIVHAGWFIYENSQRFGWYFESILNGEILPVSVIDLTLCSLETVKTQGSELYDGKVVNYTRPFTAADAEIIRRCFITVDTIEQRDNLDLKKLIDGKLVRVNDVGGVPGYYSWNAETFTWDKVDWGGSSTGGIPEIIGTTKHPITLSKLEEGLYRIKGYYRITPDYVPIIATDIDHLTFVSANDTIQIKVITENSIIDYVVEDSDITLVNTYATTHYVDDKISLIETQISEIISELPSIVDSVISQKFEPIPDAFIYSLFM